MTDAPERIWVDLFDEPMGPWCGDAFSTDSGDVSYVRADLFDAKEAEIADLRRQLAERDYLITVAGDYAAKLERQLAEAADRLAEALEFYADLSHEGPWHLPSEDYGKRARSALSAYEATKEPQPSEYEIKLAQLKKDFPNGI